MKIQNVTLKQTTNIAVMISTVVWLPTLPNLHFLIQMNKISKNNLLYQTESEKNVIFCVKQIEEIQNLVIVKLDQDTNYDVEIAMQNIHRYIRHLMRDSQQRKAKSEAFDKLSESTGFSLRISARK